MSRINRRSFLRGTMGGATIAVALPFLDCFLNDSGTAFADTGAALPVAFGTWYQALGFNPSRWVPDVVGRSYQSKDELKPLEMFKDRMNVFSGLGYFHDGKPAVVHSHEVASTGQFGGTAAPSIDNIIADAIGTQTRFRSLELSLSGETGSTSRAGGSTTYNPSEPSPAALYTRLFGPGFTDPNAADFKPDPRTLAQKSVLSYVSEDRRRIMSGLGASDRGRLDEYFTSIRQVEKQLAMALEKPAPLQSCSIPAAPGEIVTGATPEQIDLANKAMGGLLAHALACNQTRVFNMYVGKHDRIRRVGQSGTWHSLTHEEPTDRQLGYQREVAWFTVWANGVFAEFLKTLDSFKEGPGSALDRTVILWMTDHGDARVHSVENVPVITVGNAGGRLKTGFHLALSGEPSTRVGFTIQQALGLPVRSWGTLSNETSKTITDIVA